MHAGYPDGQVAGLWGQPLDQQAPTLTFVWMVPVEVSENVLGPDGRVVVNPDGTPMTAEQIRSTIQQRLAAMPVQKQQELVQLITQMMKQMHEMAMSVIRNIGG